MGFCFRSHCLLWESALVAALSTLLGGLIVWLGVRLKKEELFDGVDVKYCPLVIIAFGGWLIVVGLIGLVAFCKKTRLGVGFYASLLFITACVLIALAGVGLSISQRVYEALSTATDCQGNDYLVQANDAAQLANKQLCSAVCPCDITPNTFGETMYKNHTEGSAYRIQDCTPCESSAPEMQTYKQKAGYCDNGGSASDFQATYYSREERRYFPLLAMLEQQYECAGICQDQAYFAFTNVSWGSPKKNCREDFRTWVSEQPLRYSAVIVAVGLFLVLNVLCPCCLICKGFPVTSKGYEHAPTSTQV